MPFITAEELIDFTSIEAIKVRNPTLLSYDILEAETEIKELCGHDFSDKVIYPTIPEEVKLADFKLSQYYALVNSDESVIKGIKSQQLGDFSITTDGVEKPPVIHLLRSYMKEDTGSGNVTFRMAAL